MMDSLRTDLKSLGWKQGGILGADEEIGEQLPAGLYLVLSQTCDIYSSNLEFEPTVELLPLRLLGEGNSKAEFEGGKNSRRIHFEIRDEEGSLVWVEACCKDILQFSRVELKDHSPSRQHRLSSECLRDLLVWRAQRYLRTAFPDDFVDALRPAQKKIKKAMKALKDDLHSIKIRVDPFSELAGNGGYDLVFLFLMRPEEFTDLKVRKKVMEHAEVLENALRKLDDFEEVQITVDSLEQVTLWQIEHLNLIEWPDYDYLSFAEER